MYLYSDRICWHQSPIIGHKWTSVSKWINQYRTSLGSLLLKKLEGFELDHIRIYVHCPLLYNVIIIGIYLIIQGFIFKIQISKFQEKSLQIIVQIESIGNGFYRKLNFKLANDLVNNLLITSI